MERFLACPARAGAARCGASRSQRSPARSSPRCCHSPRRVRQRPDGPRLSKGDRRALAQAKVDRDATVRVLDSPRRSGPEARSSPSSSGWEAASSIATTSSAISGPPFPRTTWSVPGSQPVSSASSSTASSRCRIRDRTARPRPTPVPGAGRGDAAGQPLHADRATPARRRSSTPTPPGTAAASPSACSTPASRSTTPRSLTTTTGTPKIIDWVTYTHPTDDGDPTWVDHRPRSPGRPSRPAASPTPRRRRLVPLRRLQRARPAPRRRGRQRRQPRRQPGRLERHLRRAVGRRQPGLGRRRPGPQLRRRARDDELQGQPRRPLLRHRQPGDPGRRAHAVRRPDRPARSSAVNIGIVSGQHGSHVAGIIAGNGLFGGAMSGAAPGAQLVSVRVCLFVAGCTAHALIEGMIYAAKTANVDVINMSIGGLPVPQRRQQRAGHPLRPADRQVQGADVHLGRQQRPGREHGRRPVGRDQRVMSVGTYITDATWEANYGSTAPARRHRQPCTRSAPAVRARTAASSRTSSPRARRSRPRRCGSRVARSPASTRCRRATRCSTARRWPRRRPPGPQRCSSAPRSSRASSINPDSSARRSTRRRGSSDGYRRLRAGQRAASRSQRPGQLLVGQSIKTVDITSRRARSTPPSSDFLATPGIGVGIHDREGVTIGSAVHPDLHLHPDVGPRRIRDLQPVAGRQRRHVLARPVDASASPKDAARELTVNIDPIDVRRPLGDPQPRRPVQPGHRVPDAEHRGRAPRRSRGARLQRTRSRARSARNQALQLLLRGASRARRPSRSTSADRARTPGTGQARFLRFHPFGVGIDSNTSTVCYSPPVGPAGRAPAAARTAAPRATPQAGVWEVTVEARRTSDVAVHAVHADGVGPRRVGQPEP